MIGGNFANVGLQLKQVRDCTPVLTKKLAAPYSIINTYVAPGGTTTIDLNSGYLDVFDHADPTDCPLTYCNLMTNDCSTMLSPAPTHVTLLPISPTPSFKITEFIGVKLGWDLAKFCFKCGGTTTGKTFF